MVVEATCFDCQDTHPVGDRPACRGTTECPSCGSTGYSSRLVEGPATKADADRIRDAIRDVQGVGKKNLGAIVDRFGTHAEFQSASVADLEAVPGVGPTTARRIVFAKAGLADRR